MPMARSRTARIAALSLANTLLPIAVLVFAVGFFPYKPLLPGLATFEDESEPATIWPDGQPAAVFDRVVFMVVDALRTDFVYGYNSGFEFTQSLIRDGAALPFTAHAMPPTVTMPRVKALTTGSVPSFADLIFNLDESGAGADLAAQDTWLGQIKAKGGKLVFYGDDTWLRLFPGDFFERSDGTSSFFVSDFTEVDNNVTRHIPHELARDDWDAMIMHYLGLDHIGHKTGPNGPNMLPKQREMDGIVRQIYEAMETQPHHANTLLVLLGDHGMNAGGNHGGSGPGETEPALLFASPKLKTAEHSEYECPTQPRGGTEFHYYRKIEQSDVVPTLASLMQMPVPKNSLGVFIHEFMSLQPSLQDAVQLMYQNAKQVLRIVQAALGDDFHRAVAACRERFSLPSTSGPALSDSEGADSSLPCLWAIAEHELHVAHETKSWEPPSKALLEFLREAQSMMSNVASSYNIPWMVAGIVISAIATASAVLSFQKLWPPSLARGLCVMVSTLYGLMMFASSYVEEEQHFWYWLTPAWVLLLSTQSIVRAEAPRQKLRLAANGALILVIHRLAIRWNQTGQKHAGESDIVHTFFPEHHVLMWVLILATYSYVTYLITFRTFKDLVSPEIAAVAALALFVPAVVFKLNFTQADAPELVQGLALRIRQRTESYSLVLQAQVFFAALVSATSAMTLVSVGLARSTAISKPDGPAVRITLSERLHHLLTLFLMTQSRAPNVPLFLGLELQRQALTKILDQAKAHVVQRKSALIDPLQLGGSVLLLSHVYFFCFGGSNSISSIDLSNAYNGVANYNIIAVGVLLFASNWAGPIWWCSAAVLMTFSQPSQAADDSKPRLNGGRLWVEDERAKLHADAQVSRSSTNEPTRVPDHWLVCLSSMTTFTAIGLLAVMATCTTLRTHLFIWTVFSPKYLYAMAWCVGWHLAVNVGFGSLLRWLGQTA